MLRMSDDYFVVKEPKKDSVIAVRAADVSRETSTLYQRGGKK